MAGVVANQCLRLVPRVEGGPQACCIIFQARADKPVACMVAGSPHILAGLPLEGELIGEPVAVTA